MATDTLKSGSGNNLLLSNDDASAKIEVKEDGKNEITGNTGIGTGSPSSLAGYSGPILEIAGAQPVLVLHETGTGSPMWEVAGYSQEFRISDDGVDRFKIDSSGVITMPSQPAFLVQKSAGTLANVSNGDNLPYSSVIFDQGGDFDNTAFTFTAPVSGRYQLNVQMDGSSIDASARMTGFNLVTTLRTYIIRWDTDNILSADTNEETVLTGSWLCDMDASDTAKVTFYQVGGSTQYDMTEGASFFSGFLAC